MEEGDRSVEQSIAAETQGEAPAPQNVGGSAALIPPLQFPAQFAQQMAALFQQMAGNVPTPTPVPPPVQPPLPVR